MAAEATSDVAHTRPWGFSVQLPDAVLAGQTEVRFTIAGTETELAGSPIAIGAAATTEQTI